LESKKKPKHDLGQVKGSHIGSAAVDSGTRELWKTSFGPRDLKKLKIVGRKIEGDEVGRMLDSRFGKASGWRFKQPS
jgi:hypothetical protein